MCFPENANITDEDGTLVFPHFEQCEGCEGSEGVMDENVFSMFPSECEKPHSVFDAFNNGEHFDAFTGFDVVPEEQHNFYGGAEEHNWESEHKAPEADPSMEPAMKKRKVEDGFVKKERAQIIGAPSSSEVFARKLLDSEKMKVQLKPTGEGKKGKKKRLVWTPELHDLFIASVNSLGIQNAAPKTILNLMNVDGLTTEHIKSHLQKYRLSLKKQQTEGNQKEGENVWKESSSSSRSSTSSVSSPQLTASPTNSPQHESNTGMYPYEDLDEYTAHKFPEQQQSVKMPAMDSLPVPLQELTEACSGEGGSTRLNLLLTGYRLGYAAAVEDMQAKGVF